MTSRVLGSLRVALGYLSPLQCLGIIFTVRSLGIVYTEFWYGGVEGPRIIADPYANDDSRLRVFSSILRYSSQNIASSCIRARVCDIELLVALEDSTRRV